VPVLSDGWSVPPDAFLATCSPHCSAMVLPPLSITEQVIG